MSKTPKDILLKYWGHEQFKGSQKRIITSILEERDVLALLPTGGGKSVCFQVPAMVKEGICIVVSPLIALIHDQVNSLKEKGIKAIALTGGIPTAEVNDLLDNCVYGNYKFLYLSPERLQQEIVQQRIQQMNVNLIAIDEAHCISQWGHDFRPAYLACAKLRSFLPETPVIALTATATQQVSKDIIDCLKFIEPLIVKDSFARKNITLQVYWEEDKRYRLRLLCTELKKSVIVYARTRRLTQEIAQYLNTNEISATYFHGGISKTEKQEKLQLWLDNKVQIMVATSAFGMGIDKADVELVVHYQIPDSIENYFQEAGRAGRDGYASQATLITNATDIDILKKQFLSVLPDTAYLKMVYNKLNNYFQIPYGAGHEEKFQFKFDAFCQTYSLNSMLTYNALRILDQNSVIALNENFSRKSTVQFVTTKDQLFNYFEKNQNLVGIAQTILRTYGGIFDFETKINLALIAKKASSNEAKVINVLEQLQKDEVIKYEARHNDLDITFLVPREDDVTINVFAKKVKERHQLKKDNIEHMLAYVKNKSLCRNKIILEYFGEQVHEDCGICDICQLENTSAESQETIEIALLEILKNGSKSSRELIARVSYKENEVLKTIQQLLEDEKVGINDRNEYVLK